MVKCLACHHANRVKLIEAGSVQLLVKLLKSSAQEVQAAAASAVLNMVASKKSDPHNPNWGPDPGITPTLLDLVHTSTDIEKQIINVGYAWEAILVDKDHVSAFIDAGAIPALWHMLRSEADHLRILASMTLGTLAVGDVALVQVALSKFIFDPDVAPQLILLLQSKIPLVQEAAILALGNLERAYQRSVPGASYATMTTPALAELLCQKSGAPNVHMAAIYVLSNGCSWQFWECSAGSWALSSFVQLLSSDAPDVQYRAAWHLKTLATQSFSSKCALALHADVAITALSKLLRSNVHVLQGSAANLIEVLLWWGNTNLGDDLADTVPPLLDVNVLSSQEAKSRQACSAEPVQIDAFFLLRVVWPFAVGAALFLPLAFSEASSPISSPIRGATAHQRPFLSSSPTFSPATIGTGIRIQSFNSYLMWQCTL